MASINSKISISIFNNKLITPGDRVLIGVSGGIDSLVLTKLLCLYGSAKSNNITLQAVYVNIPRVEIPEKHFNRMKTYLSQWGVPFDVINGSIAEDVEFRCYACAKERRKRLCIYSRDNGFDSIALGHNLDDFLETGFMNLQYHGHLESLKPMDTMFNGFITIIRPMLFIPKRDILNYAKNEQINIEKHVCAWGRNNKRENTREIIANLKRTNKSFLKNLHKAINRWNCQNTNNR